MAASVAMRELQDQDVQFKLLTRLLPLLDQLHDMGVERDTAGNRRLFYDDYVKFVVLYLTTPIINSLPNWSVSQRQR